MKKKLVSIAAAAVMMLALPTMAFAAPSPTGNDTVTATVSGTTISAKATNGTVVIAAAEKAASTVPDGVAPLLSFKAEGDATNVTFSFNVGAQYANHNFTVYVEHTNGTAGENITGVVDKDGNLSFTVKGFSIFSVVIGDLASTTSNTGSTSPQTGVDFAGVAGGTIAMAVAAGVVFVALRKKVTE